MNVFVADVHPNEAAKASGVLKQMRLQAGVLRGEGREKVFHGGSFLGEDALAVGEFAQRRGDDQLSHVKDVVLLFRCQETRQASGRATIASSAKCRCSLSCQLRTWAVPLGCTLTMM